MNLKQTRYTLVDVSTAQDEIYEQIGNFIKNNKPLTIEEQKKFRKTLRQATYGLGTFHRVIIRGKHRSYDIGHVLHASLWLSRRTHTPIVFEKDEIELTDMWKILMDRFDDVFPYAIEMSAKMSKERETYDYGGEGGFKFGRKNKDR